MEQKLYILSGKRGCGKSTYLQKFVKYLDKKSITYTGVLAPGVFEGKKKVAIDNVLLPEGERFRFADHKVGGGQVGFSKNWKFDLDAMDKVNEYFHHIEIKDFVIVDELGPLELVQNKGIFYACRLLVGLKYKRAVVVVRPHQVETAKIKFSTSPRIKVIDTDTKFSSLIK
ncbi:MAG: nucleoside-triphosphatase [Coriobacteriia bacterium]|nr:nucleoside-triphosphatase [Coriobacteriia bacterium]